MLLVTAALLASCGAPAPTDRPAASAAVPSAASQGPTVSPAASTSRPTASPTPTAPPTPSASPTAPPITGATQTACPGAASSAHRGRVAAAQSRNWAGYVVGSAKARATCVEGTWVQPKVSCPASGTRSVAVWVGIDGSGAAGGLPDTSATLAQTGTATTCSHGKAEHYAWYEFLPDQRHMVPLDVPVAVGDKVWAKVRYVGTSVFEATLINLTQRVGAVQRWTLRDAPRHTVEWVVEDPAAECTGTTCTFLRLARFSTVRINGAATFSGTRYRLDAVPFPYLRTSIIRSGRTLASPSSLTSRGFTVAWKAS